MAILHSASRVRLILARSTKTNARRQRCLIEEISSKINLTLEAECKIAILTWLKPHLKSKFIAWRTSMRLFLFVYVLHARNDFAKFVKLSLIWRNKFKQKYWFFEIQSSRSWVIQILCLNVSGNRVFSYHAFNVSSSKRMLESTF